MIESTVHFVPTSEQLPLSKQAEKAMQQDVAGSDALEAHIAKMSIANSSGALKRQFRNIVTEK